MPIDLTDIAGVIADLGNPGGVVLVELGRSAVVLGRPGLPLATMHVVADAVHHPDPGAVNVTPVGAYLDNVDRLAVYLRERILPAVVDPDGSQPWWVVANGKRYGVTRVDDWSAGGFWVARCERLAEDGRTMPVWFGSIVSVSEQELIDVVVAAMVAAGVDPGGAEEIATALVQNNVGPEAFDEAIHGAGIMAALDSISSDGFDEADADAVSAAYAELYSSGEPDIAADAPTAFSPSRSMRVSFAAGPASVFIAWPTAIQQPTDDVVFHVVNSDGLDQIAAIEANEEIDVGGVAVTVVTLAFVPSPDGSMRLEVV